MPIPRKGLTPKRDARHGFTASLHLKLVVSEGHRGRSRLGLRPITERLP